MRELHEVRKDSLTEAREQAFEFLDGHRRKEPDSWVGQLSSSALATAMSSLALYLQPDPGLGSAVRPGLAWLAATQNPDGGWGDAVTDGSNLNATSITTAVLQYCAARQYPEEIKAGRRWVEEAGGFKVLNDPRAMSMSAPARMLYALAGLLEWGNIRKLPTEVILLPPRVRRTVSITFSSILSFAVLQERFAPVPRWRRPVRQKAISESVAWLREAQGSDGSYGLSAILTSITVMALTLADAGGADIIEKGKPFIVESQRADGSWPMDRDLENFDTTQAVLAYHEAPRPVPGHEGVRDWFLENQFRGPCFHTSSPPGGWAWAQPAGWPDVDDTACTVRSLRLLGVAPGHGAIRAGLRWLHEMQNSDGSWPTFVRDSKVPFDRGCPYITSQVLSAFAAVGPEETGSEAAKRAIAYLRKNQLRDGSFGSLWFRAHTRGTAAVIEAFSDLGLRDYTVFRAAEWLQSRQNPDGGWGNGHGAASTAEETAWATAALLRLNSHRYWPAIRRGVEWLLDHQREGGGWDPSPVGLYFSSVVYSNSFYALSYPLIALARYEKAGYGEVEGSL